MTVSPGILADAHRVARLVGGRYISWAKEVARYRVLRDLRRVEPTLVLDLWGGGRSASAIANAGLSVVSVDDGRSFDMFGVTIPRGKRALQICADEAGYEWAWGDAATVANRADAAFLDFMGHWSPEVKRTLLACRHMKAVAVTLMPERTPLGRLDADDWLTAYKALLESTLQMKVRWVHVYRRNDQNQRATVFFLREQRFGTKPASVRSCIDCSGLLRGMRGGTLRCAACKVKREKARKKTPESLARQRERSKNYRHRPFTPEQRAEYNRRQMENYYARKAKADAA